MSTTHLSGCLTHPERLLTIIGLTFGRGGKRAHQSKSQFKSKGTSYSSLSVLLTLLCQAWRAGASRFFQLLLSVTHVQPLIPFHFQNKNRTNYSMPKYMYSEAAFSSASWAVGTEDGILSLRSIFHIGCETETLNVILKTHLKQSNLYMVQIS